MLRQRWKRWPAPENRRPRRSPSPAAENAYSDRFALVASPTAYQLPARGSRTINIEEAARMTKRDLLPAAPLRMASLQLIARELAEIGGHPEPQTQ